MHDRKVKPEDFGRIREMFLRQGFGYELPEFRDFIARRTVCDENDLPQMAICARPTVELYMLANPDWATPGIRFSALDLIHERMRIELMEKGIMDAHVWLPPQKAASFGRRLERSFGWQRNTWLCLSRETSQ